MLNQKYKPSTSAGRAALIREDKGRVIPQPGTSSPPASAMSLTLECSWARDAVVMQLGQFQMLIPACLSH